MITETRRLTAVVFTDIVGYTSLMAKDEEKALKVVQQNREIQNRLSKQFNCEFFTDIGDGSLICFKSALDAVRCSIEIQNTAKNVQDLVLRIGIHIGEVLFKDGDVFGDGVNVASRIEPLAESGGICFSEHVYQLIRNQSDIDAVIIGEKKLKNVAYPVKIYALKMEDKTGYGLELEESLKDRVSKNSIAVLPFDDMSQKMDQEYFCEGLAEEIITSLSHIEDLYVVARTSAFAFKGKQIDIREIGKILNVNYILEGSIRKAGSHLRISAQLIQVSDGFHVWSEKYDRELEDIFDIQDDISLAIVDKLKVKLFSEEKKNILKHHTDNQEVYNLLLRGQYFLNKGSNEGIKTSIGYFKQAIELSPDNASVLARFALANLILCFYHSESPDRFLPDAQNAALRALQLDPYLAEAHTAVGFLKMVYEWDWDGAEQSLKRALKLNPNNSTVHSIYAGFWVVSGQLDKAIEENEISLKFDPLSIIRQLNQGVCLLESGKYQQARKIFQQIIELESQSAYGLWFLGQVDILENNLEQGLVHIEKALILSSENPIILSGLGCAYAAAGQEKKAREIISDLLGRLKKEYIRPSLIAKIFIAIDDKENAFKWLEKAYMEHDVSLPFTLRDESIKKIRDDHRYQELLHKIGLK